MLDILFQKGIMSMWTIEPTEEYERRHRRYEKNHPRELKAVLVNQATYLAALQMGINPLQIKYGFIHPDGMGVISLDQKRGGGSLAETRLYLYPETENKVLYQLTLGDKRSQREDIQWCHEFVAHLLKGKKKNEPDQGDTNEGEKEAV